MKERNQSFEVTLEHRTASTLSMDPESPPPEDIMPIHRPSAVQRELTAVSKLYDRDGKGYLNETERALRNMDTQNKGYLDTDKVYLIMQSLQDEQQRNNELMETIREEHKKALNLKKGVIGLGVFAVLLAVANIGTSFAVARLTRETKVQSNGDWTDLEGHRLATTSKVDELQLLPIPESERRRLRAVQDLACGNVQLTEDGEREVQCQLQGKVMFGEAVDLYQKFCSRWPNRANVCLGGGVDKVHINCNGKISTVHGGSKIPAIGPTLDTLGYEYLIFPTQGTGFEAEQELLPASVANSNSGNALARRSCTQEFQLGLYCETVSRECYAFASYDPVCGNNYEGVAICGPDPVVNDS
jgi:hypothetical protein